MCCSSGLFSSGRNSAVNVRRIAFPPDVKVEDLNQFREFDLDPLSSANSGDGSPDPDIVDMGISFSEVEEWHRRAQAKQRDSEG